MYKFGLLFIFGLTACATPAQVANNTPSPEFQEARVNIVATLPETQDTSLEISGFSFGPGTTPPSTFLSSQEFVRLGQLKVESTGAESGAFTISPKEVVDSDGTEIESKIFDSIYVFNATTQQAIIGPVDPNKEFNLPLHEGTQRFDIIGKKSPKNFRDVEAQIALYTNNMLIATTHMQTPD